MSSMASSDFSEYPNAAVLAGMGVLDFFCRRHHLASDLLQCADWRDWLDCQQGRDACANHYEQSIMEALPPVMPFAQYQQANADTPVLFLQQVYQYAFHTSSTSLSVLTTPTSLLVLLALVLTLRWIKKIVLPWFSSIGRRAGRATHGVNWEAHNEIRIVKFGEYVFRLLYHSCICIYGLAYFWNVPWWTDTKLLFDNYPLQPIAPAMTWYYLIQGAYNIEALIGLLELSLQIQWKTSDGVKCPILTWRDSVRGDFREMCIHHVVTNLLVLGSSFFRLHRIGSMTFLVHDISDVPVDISKLANFVKWKMTTALCFATLMLFWLVFRLLILPFVIYRSVLFESHLVLSNGVLEPHLYLLHRPFFYYLVGQIIILHVVWFFMLLRMGYVLVFKGEAHDLSEHKNGELHHTGITNGGETANGVPSNGTSNGKKVN